MMMVLIIDVNSFIIMWLRALAMLLLLQATANTQKLQSPAIGGQPHLGITLSMNIDSIAFK
jgi:hypothetical protein